MTRSGTVFESTVKSPALVAVPPGVGRLRAPNVAPAGTVVLICVLESTVKTVLVPLNFTAEAELKFVPVITMLPFTMPLVGEKPAMTGPGGLIRRCILLRRAGATAPGKAVKNVKAVCN